jgi:hypothetical protein
MDGNKTYFAVCLLNNKVNIICDDGTYLFDEWFDNFISLTKLVNLENLKIKDIYIFGIKKGNKYKFIHFCKDKACVILPEWVDSIKFVTGKTCCKLECYLDNECVYTYIIKLYLNKEGYYEYDYHKGKALLLKGNDDYHIIGDIIVKSNNTLFNVMNNGQLKYKNWIDLNKFNAKIDIEKVKLQSNELLICQINNKYNIYDVDQDKMLLNESVDDIVYKNDCFYILELNNLKNIYVLPTESNKHYIKNNGYAFKEWVIDINHDINGERMQLLGCRNWDSKWGELRVEDIHKKYIWYVACTQFD